MAKPQGAWQLPRMLAMVGAMEPKHGNTLPPCYTFLSPVQIKALDDEAEVAQDKASQLDLADAVSNG